MAINLGGGDNTFTSNADITGRFVYQGQSGNDIVTLGADGTLKGNVDIKLGSGENSFTLNGNVEGNLSVVSANADDTLTVAETATVSGTTTLGAGEQREHRRGGRIGGLIGLFANRR